MRALALLLAIGFVLVSDPCSFGQNPIVNGDFSDPTGAPWQFFDQSTDGAVSYATGAAVITGGDDGNSNNTLTFIDQTFQLAPGMAVASFDWSYATTDAAGYDSCRWALIDLDASASVIGGALTLADADGMSGSVSMTFTGGGNYRLRLQTWSDDNVGGPGVSTFDNVVISGTLAGQPYVRGDVNDDGGVSLPDAIVLLNFLFPMGGPTPLICDDAGDANDDGSINLTDAVAVLTALFGQPAVPLPGPSTCGPDVTDTDPLDCSSAYTSC
ncbi:MAG: dockerin type I domain-containing protein [Planctomycetota bacterium]